MMCFGESTSGENLVLCGGAPNSTSGLADGDLLQEVQVFSIAILLDFLCFSQLNSYTQ